MPSPRGRHTSSAVAGAVHLRRRAASPARPLAEFLEARRLLSGGPPVVATLVATPDPVAPGDAFTLLCGDVSDPENDPVTVRFYRESNGLPGLQEAATQNRPPDLLLGADQKGDYLLDLVAPPTNGVACHTYYAVADDGTSPGAAASASQTVILPTLRAATPVAYAGDVLTLVTAGAVPGASSVGVMFYQESNGQPGCQPDADTYVGLDLMPDNPGALVPEYSASLVPRGDAPETRTYYAFVSDGRHAPVGLVVTLSHPFGGVPARPADAFEPNPSPERAPVVVFGSTRELTGLTAWAGDEDWYLVSFIAPGDLEVELISPDPAARGDMTVELYDGGRTLLAQSPAPAPGPLPEGPRVVSAPIAAYQFYYVRVHTPSHDARPQYGLRLKRTGPAAIDFRYAAYKNSALDGHDATPGVVSDAAIARDKGFIAGDWAEHTPIPQQVTSYDKGINALVIDVLGLPPAGGGGEALCAADFEFRAGTGGDSAAWPLAPAPTGVGVRRGAGAGGTDRVAITWPDGAIANRWVRVTMKPGANTGLPAPDVFFYGNLVGDTGGAAAFGLGYPPVQVDRADVINVRRSFVGDVGAAAAVSPYDHNRDGVVNGADLLLTLRNLRRSLAPIKMPATGTATASAALVTAAAAVPQHASRTRPSLRTTLFAEEPILR